MEAKDTTDLKDSILLYLFDRAIWRISLSEIYYDLKPENLPKEVFHNILEDMVLDKLIASLPIPGCRNQYCITERGKRRLKERGYTTLLGIDLERTELNKLIFPRPYKVIQD
jgi:hypothetical protein